jgi:DUF4097 and DUF4098 domain-containing protein YvlB
MKFSEGTRVLTSFEDGQFHVRVEYPQRQTIRISFWDLFSGYEFPHIEVRLGLEIPAGVAVTLGSTSGDLETDSLSGRQSLTTTSGDVEVHGAAAVLEIVSTSGDIIASDIGSATMHTVSGDVHVDGVSGALRVQTTSGDIRISGGADSLSLSTVSGDVEADAAPRGVRAETTSGDIVLEAVAQTVHVGTSSGDVRVGLRVPLLSADIASVSGNLTVALADRLGCALDVKTSNGTLDADVPLEMRTISRRAIAGSVRDGTAPVRLRTASGDITIRSGGI